jgi:hypothetical protein
MHEIGKKERAIMEWLHEFFQALIAGFGRIILTAMILWMISLIVLLFWELFSPGDIQFRSYLYRVWKWLLWSFEIASYGGVIVAPILMYRTKEYLNYGMVLFAAIVFSAVLIYLRRNTKLFTWRAADHSTKKTDR